MALASAYERVRNTLLLEVWSSINMIVVTFEYVGRFSALGFFLLVLLCTNWLSFGRLLSLSYGGK
jgi:hypothetical protein